MDYHQGSRFRFFDSLTLIATSNGLSILYDLGFEDSLFFFECMIYININYICIYYLSIIYQLFGNY
jgi:hypothetical protein